MPVTAPQLRPDWPEPTVVVLSEWSELGSGEGSPLRGLTLRDHPGAVALAESLGDKVVIQERYDGLTVSTTSWVGHVDIGPLRIVVQPKLPLLPLSDLLRYAYELRDLDVYGDSVGSLQLDGLQDLLVLMLTIEVSELLNRGLVQQYVRRAEPLTSPRGRILLDEFVRRGGLRDATLPCEYHARSANWLLNQTLRAGLELASSLAENIELRRRAKRLVQRFLEVGTHVHIDAGRLDQAEQRLTRMTRAYASALVLIRVLFENQGSSLHRETTSTPTPGFLFDMNAFFQRLVSRFLREHLPGHRIDDERRIRNVFAYASTGNPRNLKAPKPRPDYALFQGSNLLGFLDAKYRDVWAVGYPMDWLYQLSLYVLASPSRSAVLLYATMSKDACEEKILVQSPTFGTSEPLGSVIIRPVPLQEMASLVTLRNQSHETALHRTELARRLVAL